MIGRLVLEAWQEDPKETVFIDRNGDTFAYVLDYLRYGSINLPITIPKTTFDRDIDYYGIKAAEGTIKQESVYSNEILFHRGTGVVCQGLVKLTHLNGKIGDVHVFKFTILTRAGTLFILMKRI
ncbi:hypothetical protein ACHAWF_013920 [Thalassiosira exigua]